MIMGLITLGVVGAVYVTGDEEKKQKMREVCHGIAEITKDTALDIAAFTQKNITKIREKRAGK